MCNTHTRCTLYLVTTTYTNTERSSHMTTTSSPSANAVPETIPAHTVTTDTAKVKVETSEFHFDAGVGVTVSTYSSEQGLGTALSEQHRTYASISLNLTPDECDELAAMLCAHAFDRRRVKDAKDAAFNARRNGVQA